MQGSIGLSATGGAKLCGATIIIRVDKLAAQLEVARRVGADHVIDSLRSDPVVEIMRFTEGRGVDVAIEALGTQATFEACLRMLKPGGTLSQPWSVLEQPHHSGRPVRGWLRRSQDRYDAVPWWAGAHAPADVGYCIGTNRPAADGDAPVQARPDRAGMSYSVTNAMAFSRWRSRRSAFAYFITPSVRAQVAGMFWWRKLRPHTADPERSYPVGTWHSSDCGLPWGAPRLLIDGA